MRAHSEGTTFSNEIFITFKFLKAALALRKSKVTLSNVERLFCLFCANSKYYVNEKYWVKSLTKSVKQIKVHFKSSGLAIIFSSLRLLHPVVN